MLLDWYSGDIYHSQHLIPPSKDEMQSNKYFEFCVHSYVIFLISICYITIRCCHGQGSQTQKKFFSSGRPEWLIAVQNQSFYAALAPPHAAVNVDEQWKNCNLPVTCLVLFHYTCQSSFGSTNSLSRSKVEMGLNVFFVTQVKARLVPEVKVEKDRKSKEQMFKTICDVAKDLSVSAIRGAQVKLTRWRHMNSFNE